MRGPEHYRRGEELLADITNDDGSICFGDGGEAYVAAAQAHFLAALVAANVEAAGLDQAGTLGIASDWARALNGGAP